MQQFLFLSLMIGFAMVNISMGCHRIVCHGCKPGPGQVKPGPEEELLTSATYIRGFLSKHGASKFVITCTIDKLGISNSFLSPSATSLKVKEMMEKAKGRSKRYLNRIPEDNYGDLVDSIDPVDPIDTVDVIKNENIFENCGHYQTICNAAKTCYEEEKEMKKFVDFVGDKEHPIFKIEDERQES